VEIVLNWKDILLLRWAFGSRPVVIYPAQVDTNIKSPESFVRGVTNLHALLEYLALGTIAFIFMMGCTWTIFVTNANIFVLIICIPLGGLATLFWLAYGFLIISEVVLGSK
jgi:hypothetical protein